MSDEVQEPAPVEESAPVEEPAPAQEEEAPKEEAPKASSGSACSGECPCDMICKPFQESEFFGKAKELFMWTDLMKSLLAFCIFQVFFVLLLCYDFTVIGLVCWVCFFALIAALCFDIQHVIAYFKGEDAKGQLADKNFEVPAEYIDGFFSLVAAVIKALIGVCVNAILIRSVPFSLGMIFGFLFTIYLSAKMGICGMLYAAIFFCFIWFRLYHDKKDTIDGLFQKLKDLINQQIQNIKEKINKPKAQ